MATRSSPRKATSMSSAGPPAMIGRSHLKVVGADELDHALRAHLRDQMVSRWGMVMILAFLMSGWSAFVAFLSWLIEARSVMAAAGLLAVLCAALVLVVYLMLRGWLWVSARSTDALGSGDGDAAVEHVDRSRTLPDRGAAQ